MSRTPGVNTRSLSALALLAVFAVIIAAPLGAAQSEVQPAGPSAGPAAGQSAGEDAAEDPAVSSPGAPSPEELLERAAVALQAEDYPAAAAALEPYLAQRPEDYRARFNLALAFSMTGRQGDAVRFYQQILAQQPELIPARVNLGILLLQQGSAAAALVQFELVVAGQPDHWAAQVNRAGALVALERNEEAAQAYLRALELEPDHAATQLAAGEVLVSLDLAAAEKHLRRALELDPALEEAEVVLAGVLVERAGQGADTLAAAASIYERLLASQPDSAELRVRLADIYRTQNRLAEAIQQLEAARTATPSDVQLNRALLDVYLEAKLHDKAQALLPDVLASRPGDAELYMLQGTLWMEKRQYPEAADSFRRAIRLDPQQMLGYTNLASALYLMKEYEGTVVALENVAAMGRDTAGTYFLRAITLDKLGVKEAAFENYELFLDVDGPKPEDQEFQARQRLIVLGRELKRSPRRR